jgi:hypothetical protein
MFNPYSACADETNSSDNTPAKAAGKRLGNLLKVIISPSPILYPRLSFYALGQRMPVFIIKKPPELDHPDGAEKTRTDYTAFQLKG